MVDLKRAIDEDQRTYVQWAEEKLSLANIAADLLIQHRTAVDKDVGALLAELKVWKSRQCKSSTEVEVMMQPSHPHSLPFVGPQNGRKMLVYRCESSRTSALVT